MTNPYFNVIEVRCIWCNKLFSKATKSKVNGRRKLPNVRNHNAITCSPECSRNYASLKRSGKHEN